MECEEVLVRLWEYLDQELGPKEAEAVGAHLESCPGCYPAFGCGRALLRVLARQRMSCTAPTHLVQSIRVRLMAS
jgi:mycothiol system anti-sigma-R factor